MRHLPTVLLTMTLMATACSSNGADGSAGSGSVVADSVTSEATAPELTAPDAEQRFPDVVGVVATLDESTWTFDVTISSPYDSPERYADAWRVLGPDGTEYGIRDLDHDHATEQPFTRSQSGIEIPDDVATVTVQGRDQQNGWGGTTFELRLEQD